MSGLFAQIEAFLLTLILGVFAGLIFHYYQSTITRAKVGKYWLYFLDLFLWIIMICLVFLCMLMINQGEMRIYVLLALLLGILIYFRCLYPRLKRPVSWGVDTTIKLWSLLGKGIKKPFYCLKARIKEITSRHKSPPPPNDDA